MNEISVKPDLKKVISNNDLKKLLELVNSISHGSVTLFIQDGKAIQIEKHEKMRLR